MIISFFVSFFPSPFLPFSISFTLVSFFTSLLSVALHHLLCSLFAVWLRLLLLYLLWGIFFSLPFILSNFPIHWVAFQSFHVSMARFLFKSHVFLTRHKFPYPQVLPSSSLFRFHYHCLSMFYCYFKQVYVRNVYAVLNIASDLLVIEYSINIDIICPK